MIDWIFSQAGHEPGSYCVADNWLITWLLFGHLSIALAYITVAAEATWLVWRLRRNGGHITLRHEGWSQALLAFLLLMCGCGRLLMALDLFHSWYRLEAVWHTATGFASLATVAMLPVTFRLTGAGKGARRMTVTEGPPAPPPR